MGVACLLAEKNGIHVFRARDGKVAYTTLGAQEEVADYYDFNLATEQKLMHLNDLKVAGDYGWSWDHIADIIEATTAS